MSKFDECSGEPVPFYGWFSDDTVCEIKAGGQYRIDDGRQNINRHDPVNHPKHYTSHPSGVECIEITRHMSFSLGNVVKYVWRAGLKDTEITDKELEDLKKAMWYLQDAIAVIEEKRNV